MHKVHTGEIEPIKEEAREMCNHLLDRQQFHLSEEDMRKVKENSIEAERATKILGEMPSLEERNKLLEKSFKGNVYQRRKNAPQQHPTKVSSPTTQVSAGKSSIDFSTNANLDFDITGILNTLKIPIPVVELVKFPIFKEQIMKAFGFKNQTC